MPFREKIAWISVVTIVIVWGTYFAFLLTAVAQGRTLGHAYFAGFFVAALIQIGLAIIGSIVTAVTAPRDAQAGRDERDRAIASRSAGIAYPVLLTAVLMVTGSLHLGLTAIGMGYGIMGAIVVGEIVRYGAQIVGYRSGRHG